MIHPSKTPADTPSSIPPQTVQKPVKLTARSVIIGALMIPLLVYWVEYTEIVASGPDLAAMSLPMAVVFGLLVLIGINIGIKRLWPATALTQSELLTIFIMGTVSIGICGIGMMQFLTPMLAGWSYFATPENHWSNWHHYLPLWAMASPSVIPDYYNGKTSVFRPEILAGWAQPIAVWSAFIFVLLSCMYCISALFRRQWVDSERLIFPIVQIPLAITKNGGDTPLWRNKVLWMGVAIPVILESMAVIHFTMLPTFPYFPIKPEASLQIEQSIKTPPWNAIGYTTLAFYPLVIGLTYLVSLDVSFSCWFFYLVTKLEAVAATAFGFRDPGAGPALARVPYSNEQGVGAFIGLALFSIFLAWPHLKTAWKKALGDRDAIDDSNEPLSYRAAFIGLILSALLLVAFGVVIGLSLLISVAFFTLFFLLALAFTRIRAEAGLPWGQSAAGQAHGTIAEFSGTQNFTQQELTSLTLMSWFDTDSRCLAMPSQLEAMKIGDMSEPRSLNQRSITKVVAFAVIIGIAASWLSCLGIYYHWGAGSAHLDQWRTGQGHYAYDTLQGYFQAPKPLDGPRIGGAVVGLIVVTLLSILRTQFVWWPLHPIGYAVGNTDTMTWIWFPTLLGWAAKSMIIRYGGVKTYRLALPFFLGLVFGDYAISGIWALFFLATGHSGYRTFPI